MNTERKLASVQIIDKLLPIKKADKIEIAVIKGWNVVVQKGEFSVGDKVVYFEIDSFLPVENSHFDFLRKNSYKNTKHLGEGYRIKTIKLREQISQGLIMPLSILPCGEYNVDDDVTKLLNVKKYERYIPDDMIGVIKGDFPSFISKTSTTRIQNNYDDIEYKYKEFSFELTEKLDGMSTTTYYYNGDVGVCSRTLEYLLDGADNQHNLLIKTVNKHNFLNALRELKMNIAIQGELVGSQTQASISYGLKEHFIYVFDIYLIDKQRYANRDERLDIIKQLENTGVHILQVPFLGIKMILPDLDVILKTANGKSQLNDFVKREGVVWKSLYVDEDLNEIITFKAISNDFLLEESDG